MSAKQTVSLLSHALVVGALSTLCASSALAAPRTFIASYGDDGSPACSLPVPCRLLPRALAGTDDGGEVIVLDSANYNVDEVVVTQSVVITAAPGIFASLVALPGQNALRISNASANVVLRNFTLVGRGGGNGVVVEAAAKAHLENCVIENMSSIGVLVQAPDAQVFISDTIVRENTHTGIFLVGSVTATLSGVRVLRNGGNGIEAQNGARAAMRDSVVAGNASNGILAQSSNAATPAYLSVENTVASYNGGCGVEAFVSAGGMAETVASNNTVTNNQTGLCALGAGTVTLLSRRNNTVARNTSADTAGTITTLNGL